MGQDSYRRKERTGKKWRGSENSTQNPLSISVSAIQNSWNHSTEHTDIIDKDIGTVHILSQWENQDFSPNILPTAMLGKEKTTEWLWQLIVTKNGFLLPLKSVRSQKTQPKG